jgi:putative inorganic carbon (HCO3(-)) transporter
MGGPAGSSAARALEADTAVLDMRPLGIWRALRRESAAFWGLNAYLFVEYVRPQSVWPAIDILPWGQLALAFTVWATLTEPRVRRGFVVIDALLILFSAVVLGSLVVAHDPAFGVGRLEIFVNWLVLYYLICRLVNTEVRLFMFIGAFCLWSLKMSQFGTRAFISTGFSFRNWGTGGGPGWFQNSGEFAIQMCVFLGMTLPLILALRGKWPKWKTYLLLALLPGTALISVIASSSRGGQLGAAVVLMFLAAHTRHRVRAAAWAAILLPLLWMIVPAEQKARFSEMGDDQTSQTRLTYWKDGLDIMHDHPVLGVGYANWLPYYQRYYNPVGQVPHNIFIEAGAELGYVGLTAFLLLIGATFAVNSRTRRLARRLPRWGLFYRSLSIGLDSALVGYLVTGFFVTVLYYPFFWVNLSLSSATFLLAQRRTRSSSELLRRRKSAGFRSQFAPSPT